MAQILPLPIERSQAASVEIPLRSSKSSSLAAGAAWLFEALFPLRHCRFADTEERRPHGCIAWRRHEHCRVSGTSCYLQQIVVLSGCVRPWLSLAHLPSVSATLFRWISSSRVRFGAVAVK